jgi:hypothetical protein
VEKFFHEFSTSLQYCPKGQYISFWIYQYWIPYKLQRNWILIKSEEIEFARIDLINLTQKNLQIKNN